MLQVAQINCRWTYFFGTEHFCCNTLGMKHGWHCLPQPCSSQRTGRVAAQTRQEVGSTVWLSKVLTWLGASRQRKFWTNSPQVSQQSRVKAWTQVCLQRKAHEVASRLKITGKYERNLNIDAFLLVGLITLLWRINHLIYFNVNSMFSFISGLQMRHLKCCRWGQWSSRNMQAKWKKVGNKI